MVENDKNEEVIETTKKDKLYWFKFFSAVILGVVWIILIIIKFANPDFKLLIPSIITGVLTGLLLISIIGKKIYEGMKKKDDVEKIPDPISVDEVFKIIKNTIQGTKEKDYKDGLFRNGRRIFETRPYHISKNLIYAMKVDLSDKIKFSNGYTSEIWVIVNATYPKIKPAVLPGNITEYRLKEIVNSISSNPKDEPDEEKRTETDLLTGKQIIYKKKSHRKRKKPEKKEESVV